MRVPSYNDHAINARRKTCNQSTTRSARGCHPCLRYDLLPMSPVRTGDCVVELVGLEPTTRVLWNMGVSDQLTRSDTRPRARRGPLLMGISTKGNLGLPSRGMGSPGVPRTTAAFFPPRRHHHWALPLLLRAASHDR